MSIIPSPTPKISPNVGYWQDCNTIVYTMNSLRTFIHFYYQDRTPYVLNSDNHIPKMFTHNLLNCPILIIKSNVSHEMTKQSVQFMWTWFFSELKKRTAPVFFDFTETHPTIITKLCSALQCVVSFKMRGYSASLDKLFILKTLRGAFIIVTPQCSHLPPATILSLDCLAMQEHIDWRPLLRPETKELTYFAAQAEMKYEHFANLFQPNLDKVTILKMINNTTVFDRGASMLKSMISIFYQFLDRCLRARAVANAKQIEVNFIYTMLQSDMLFLSLNAVRGAILQNPSIQRTLVALHCCTWNPITFKITFGDRVTMETLIDDTPGSDEIYYLETIVKKSLAQKVYCCNLR